MTRKPLLQGKLRRWWLTPLCVLLGFWGGRTPLLAQEDGGESDADTGGDEEAALEEEEAGEWLNWVEFGVGGVFVDGSRASYQQMHQVPEVLGGISGLHYERDLGRDWRLTLDGRGIFNEENYSISLRAAREDRGYVKVRYDQFRTWSDASGGYLPAGNVWYDLFDPEMGVDRGSFSLEAGLTLPEVPKVTFEYRHTFREGGLGSTVWGVASVPGIGDRGVTPSFLGLDEERDMVRLDVTHQFGEKVKAGLGVRYDTGRIDNARYSRQYPGQPGDAHITSRDQVEDDVVAAHSFVETRLSEKVLLTLGYAYSDYNSDHAGYRVYGAAYDPDLAQRLPAGGTYERLSGGALAGHHTGNLNLLVDLHENLKLIPSFRIDRQDLSGVSFYQQPAGPLGPTYQALSERGFLELTENLELRYTGWANWVLYARGEWLQGSGDLREDWDNLVSGAPLLRRATDDDRTAQKYVVGANWYPASRLSLSTEYFHKIRDNDFDHPGDTTSNLPGSLMRYPAFLRAQSFDTDDVSVRASFRPAGTLRVVGRYDFQRTTLDTRPDNLAEIQTSEMTGHIASGSISWVPWARLYLMGMVSYVFDRTETPASAATPLVADAHNDYWSLTASVGYALDERTDLEVQYLYYLVDNYVDRSAVSTPYGAGAEQHGILVGLNRRLNARTRLGLQYGFFDYQDELSGGHRDYQAHLLYTTLSYRF